MKRQNSVSEVGRLENAQYGTRILTSDHSSWETAQTTADQVRICIFTLCIETSIPSDPRYNLAPERAAHRVWRARWGGPRPKCHPFSRTDAVTCVVMSFCGKEGLEWRHPNSTAATATSVVATARYVLRESGEKEDLVWRGNTRDSIIGNGYRDRLNVLERV